MAKRAMRRITVYQSYRFKGKDPILERLLNIADDSGFSRIAIARKSGVSPGTLHNWKRPVTKGGTRSPKFSTLNAAARACGHELVFRSMALPNGDR